MLLPFSFFLGVLCYRLDEDCERRHGCWGAEALSCFRSNSSEVWADRSRLFSEFGVSNFHHHSFFPSCICNFLPFSPFKYWLRRRPQNNNPVLIQPCFGLKQTSNYLWLTLKGITSARVEWVASLSSLPFQPGFPLCYLNPQSDWRLIKCHSPTTQDICIMQLTLQGISIY